MAELDKSRDLTFKHVGTELAIMVPIVGVTPQWVTAFGELANEQHAEIELHRDGQHLFMHLIPGTSTDDV